MFLQDNLTVTAIFGGVLGLNTLGIFGLLFHVGEYKGKLEQWCKGTDEKIAKNETAIATIHDQDIRNVKIDAALTAMGSSSVQQDKVIRQLRRRTHDLRNVLQHAKLIMPGQKVAGFEGTEG